MSHISSVSSKPKPLYFLKDWQRKETMDSMKYCKLRLQEEGITGKAKKIFIRSCLQEVEACKAFLIAQQVP